MIRTILGWVFFVALFALAFIGGWLAAAGFAPYALVALVSPEMFLLLGAVVEKRDSDWTRDARYRKGGLR